VADSADRRNTWLVQSARAWPKISAGVAQPSTFVAGC
jgi:hypothetical protein